MPFLERVCLCGSSWAAAMQYFIFPDSELAWQRAVFGAWFVNVLLGVGKGKQGKGGGGENYGKYQMYTKVERII